MRVVSFVGRVKVVRAKGHEYVRIYVDRAEVDLREWRDKTVRGLLILED